MNRLTKYEPNDESMFPYKLKDEELSTKLDSIHKLGQLEDIEEELGIDLLTLFKALKNGCFAKETFDYMGKKQTQIIFTEFTQLYYANDLDDYLIHIRTRDYYLKDYGKTWALTKEELENE